MYKNIHVYAAKIPSHLTPMSTPLMNEYDDMMILICLHCIGAISVPEITAYHLQIITQVKSLDT